MGVAVETNPVATAPVKAAGSLRSFAPAVTAALLFAILFQQPIRLLVLDWWNDPEAGHGLLLAPLAAWLAWKTGLRADRQPQLWLGSLTLGAAVLLRYVSGLAAEMFTMRLSALLAIVGLVVFVAGRHQVKAWWLPFSLLLLSIPLPALIINSLALPLQFTASKLGAGLLAARHVPVWLSGNVIMLPNTQLFVTEACSGLRSLTALLSLGVLIGGLWLRHPVARGFLILCAIPVALAINAVRVFLTGFLVYYVSPELGVGFMHSTEGWLLFLVAFGILGGVAWVVAQVEQLRMGARSDA